MIEQSNRKFYLIFLLVSIGLAGIVSFYASSSPDGLEKVAGDIGFIETAKDHRLDNSALADYGVAGIENERLSVGIAGILGVIATGVLMYLIIKFISRKKN
jgi:cobalt/nickel transport protein